MIKQNSLFRLFWNSLIFFLVIYIAVIMPIRLAFLAQENIENVDQVVKKELIGHIIIQQLPCKRICFKTQSRLVATNSENTTIIV